MDLFSRVYRLGKVQGSQEKRMRRISNTLNELRTRLTPQFAKSIGGAFGSARRQGDATISSGRVLV